MCDDLLMKRITAVRRTERFILVISMIFMMGALIQLVKLNNNVKKIYADNDKLNEHVFNLALENDALKKCSALPTKESLIHKEKEKEIDKKRASKNIRKLRINAYTSSVKECGKKNGFTAISKKLATKKNFPTKAIPWETAAVGDDCFDLIGKKILINIKGRELLLKVNDRKKEGFFGIDICVDTVLEAKDIGTSIGDVKI